MSASVLLDTSFLITLVSANRPHHATAVQYYRYLLQHDVPMYFSAIVAAEFGIKQALTELPLRHFRPLDFNIAHGQKAAALWNALGKRDEGDARPVVRDDVKLLAQAAHEDIGFLLTEDASTLHKYCERLRGTGHMATRTITMTGGFDAGLLREDGQRDWIGDFSGDAES